MVKAFLILVFWLPLVAGIDLNSEKRSTPDNPAGFIDITVESNINRLFFKYDLKGVCLTLNDRIKTAYAHDTTFSVIRVPVKEFRSTNQMAYRDFLELVRSEEYPVLEIVIPDKPVAHYNSGSDLKLNGVAVTVAGVTRLYDVSCTIEKSENNRLLTGTIRIKLTDLEIEPPVKWAGLVKVRNEIIVKFGLCIRNSPEVQVKA